MKTGIVRRVDDLGRIVIPKEIRRSMVIREGEAMEIETTREGKIILSKYVEKADEDSKEPDVQVAPTPKKVTLYIDVCEGEAYKTLEELIPSMEGNGDITSFEEWLSNNYSASSLYDEIENCEGGYGEAKESLWHDYNDYVLGEAQDLIDSLRTTDYVAVEVEI